MFAVVLVPFAGAAKRCAGRASGGGHRSDPAHRLSTGVPGVTHDVDSLRFRGFLCRKSVAMSPSRVRLERLSSDGQVLDAATGRVLGLSGRGHRCTVYTVTAPWRLEPGDRVRACAQRGDGPCPAGG